MHKAAQPCCNGRRHARAARPLRMAVLVTMRWHTDGRASRHILTSGPAVVHITFFRPFSLGFILSLAFSEKELLDEIFRILLEVSFHCFWIEFMNIEDFSTLIQQLIQVSFSLLSLLIFVFRLLLVLPCLLN